MVHRPAPSRNCSKFRIIQLWLCSKHRGYPMPSRYCTSCIGCQSSNGSHTNWIQVGSSEVQSSEHVRVQLPSRCWSNRSPGQDFPNVLSGTQHRLSGTRCHKQFSSATLRLFLNLDLKLSYSRRLSLNTDPTCHQRLWVWSYDHVALYKFDYYYKILIFVVTKICQNIINYNKLS